MKLTGSHLIVKALKAEGVEKIFCLAGDHTLPLMDLMADEGFHFIDTRHEHAAVDMATAWGRVTGTPGVCLFTTPGHANAIPGLTNALKMEAPVINISGCADQSRLGEGAMQEIDQVGMAAPVTKSSRFVSDPYRIPGMFADAFRKALTGRRGPVHLTIPVDVQVQEVDESRVRFYEPREYRPMAPVPGDPGRISSALEMLQAARRPMVVAGSGAYATSGEDLRRLIEVTGMPLFTDDAARGLVSDTHPYCFGTPSPSTNAPAEYLKDADVVLLLGKKLDYGFAFGGPPLLDQDVRIIQVESSSDLIGLSRGVDLSIVGDVGAVVGQLAAKAEDYKWNEHPMLEELRSAWPAQERSLESQAADSAPLNSMSVHKVLRPLLDDNSTLIFEGSDFAIFAMAYYPSVRPNRSFTSGLGMIGFGTPFGSGVKLAEPDSKVVVLTGDGAFGFSAMELDTAVRHNIPVVVIVGTDAVWGIDYHQQVGIYGKAVATELLPTRYDKVADGLGAHAEYVEEPHQLLGALQRALASDRPALVNVRIKPEPSPASQHLVKTKRAAKEQA